MKLWIISDTHFNHKAITNKDFENRPLDFKRLIMRNWKRLVAPEDTIIHLGDVIFSRASELKEILDELPGTKILVKGNHDMNRNHWYLSKGFNFVCDKIELRVNHKNVILSHIPQKLAEGWYNVHGHLHSQGHRDQEFIDIKTDRHKLYACEIENYKPVLLEELVDR